MKIYLDCIPCFLRQALDSARLVTDDESIHEQILYDVLHLSKNLNFHQTPPAIGQQIHRRIRELTGNSDPYRDLKKCHNRFAMELYELLEPTVHSTEAPLETAVRLAIAGNIIDLGVKTSVSDSDIQKTINDSLTASFDRAMVEQLRSETERAKDILYLTDNAGEIVFDRLLIKQLPVEKVTVVVKGQPIINDATMEDAECVGLTEIAEVVDNGSDAPGTILETCSQDFRDRFEKADLIIAKGQGNYETLSDLDKNIFFILKAKCPVIARDIGCKIGDMILCRNENNKKTD
ncbi:MAG: ARMT1-like domain-containing protein [Planctomycetota bacterium]